MARRDSCTKSASVRCRKRLNALGKALITSTLRTAVRRTAPAGAAPGIGQGNFGFHREAHVGQVNGHITHGGDEFLVHAKRQAVDIKAFVVGGRLIQSQREARTASATSCKVDPHRGFVFIGEIRIKLLASFVGYMNHKASGWKVCAYSMTTGSGFVKTGARQHLLKIRRDKGLQLSVAGLTCRLPCIASCRNLS